jgi:F0F1-type ATP synthase membrane subunit c/vacuolar-type H+-ATPase subunit K
MSKFTDRLWQELMREHRAQLEAIDRPAAERRRRALPRLVAGTTVGLAGLGTAIALAIGAASSTPAFAVTKNPDGTVSVTINKLAGVAGANEKLAQIGVRAVAVPVEAGCAGAAPPVAARALAMKMRAVAAEAGTVRINPRAIPAGKRLVLAAAAAPAQVRIWKLNAALRGAPPCFREVSAAGGCGLTVFPGPPGQPGTSTTDTDTTGTTTAPPAATATTHTATTTAPTATSTTQSGTTTAPGPPGGAVECKPPPCAAGIATAPPTTTSTTGTTTAPPPASTSTTGATTTGTNTTGTTTTTGPQTAPAPGRAWFRCGPPPFCAPGRVTAVPSRGASDNAAIERKLEALRKARAALAAQLARERAKKRH